MTEDDLNFAVIRLEEIRSAKKLSEFIFMLSDDMKGDLLDLILEALDND